MNAQENSWKRPTPSYTIEKFQNARDIEKIFTSSRGGKISHREWRSAVLWFHLYAESKKVEHTETESRMAAARCGENGEMLDKGYKVPVMQDK